MIQGKNSCHQRRAFAESHERGKATPEAITMLVEETAFAWHETLGVPPNAETDAIRLAIRRLALRYHPDQGGTEAQMTRINGAYEQARTTLANRPPVQGTPPPRT